MQRNRIKKTIVEEDDDPQSDYIDYQLLRGLIKNIDDVVHLSPSEWKQQKTAAMQSAPDAIVSRITQIQKLCDDITHWETKPIGWPGTSSTAQPIAKPIADIYSNVSTSDRFREFNTLLDSVLKDTDTPAIFKWDRLIQSESTDGINTRCSDKPLAVPFIFPQKILLVSDRPVYSYILIHIEENIKHIEGAQFTCRLSFIYTITYISIPNDSHRKTSVYTFIQGITDLIIEGSSERNMYDQTARAGAVFVAYYYLIGLHVAMHILDAQKELDAVVLDVGKTHAGHSFLLYATETDVSDRYLFTQDQNYSFVLYDQEHNEYYPLDIPLFKPKNSKESANKEYKLSTMDCIFTYIADVRTKLKCLLTTAEDDSTTIIFPIINNPKHSLLYLRPTPAGVNDIHQYSSWITRCVMLSHITKIPTESDPDAGRGMLSHFDPVRGHHVFGNEI